MAGRFQNRAAACLAVLVVLGMAAGAAADPVAVTPTFASGTFTKHPCFNGAQCDTSRATTAAASQAAYYGKSRSVSFKVTTDWTGGSAAANHCMCRLRANMNGFDDPFSTTFNPSDGSTDGVSASGGALTDSQLEPWGADWYRCWDQNSDTPPKVVVGTNFHIVSGPSDAPFVNLPDGYYHFSVGCTEDIGVTYKTNELFFKIDNVAPETTITPYIAALDSSLTGYTTTSVQSYDPSASDHRMRYKQTSGTNPTNAVPTRLFDFKLSVVDYHGSANADVSPYNPYSAAVTSPNIHTGTLANIFFGELERITYQCKIDDGSWYDCSSASFGTRYSDSSYGHWYFSESGTTAYTNMYTGNRFITTKQLSTGTHVLMVKATDLAGNTEMPTMYSFYVAPHTKGGSDSGCTYGYQLTSDSSSAAYSMTDYDLEADTRLELSGLTDGDHTLKIFAKDEFGHETAEASRQSVSWTVDITAPSATLTKSWTLRNTALDSSYVANSGAASLTSAAYEWVFENTTTLSVPYYSRYSIDGQTYTMDGFTSTEATSTDGFTDLSMPPFAHSFPKHTFPVGSHSVRVLGVDYVGNVGEPAVDSFSVEELDTVLNCDNCAICDWDATTGCHSCQELSSAYVSDAITFDIHSFTDGSQIKFKYDYIFSMDADASSYKKGEHIPEFTVRNIGEGKYYVLAKGRTLGGTYDATPSCVMVSTDITKPVTTINSDLKRINNLARMPSKIAGTITDLNWKYDGTSWRVMQAGVTAPLAGPSMSGKAMTGATQKMLVTAHPDDENMALWELDLSDLVTAGTMVEGQYMLVIHSIDKAGHTGLKVSFDWLIDMGPPDTYVVNGPAYYSSTSMVRITFACEESGAMSHCSYKWRLNPTDSYTDADCNLATYCTIDVPSSAGVNTIEVKAVDLAGNEDGSSQYYTWMMFDSETQDALRNLTSFTTPFFMGPVKFEEPGPDVVQVKEEL